MGKPKKRSTATEQGSTSGNRPKADSKSARQALNVVLNIQGLVSDDTRWNSEEDVASSLTSLEQNLSKLRQHQRSWNSAIPNRCEADFSAFSGWLASVGVDMSCAPFRVGWTSDSQGVEAVDNATLFATQEIPADSIIVTVPSAAMLSTKTAMTSSIGEFIAAVPALRTTASITLALHLLAEALDAESRFQPYIRTLPSKFTIPYSLPFSTSEILALRPSDAYDRAVKSLRSQVLQYTNIYQLLGKTQTGCAALALHNFSYSNFEWAISVVMTRQNALPSAAGPQTLALVPVWDMCNHAPGPRTTGVLLDPQTDDASVECAAMRTFQPGDPITIFYGTRPNVELLLFSGFVQPGNAHDDLSMTVPLSGEDRRALVAKSVLVRRELGKDAARVTIASEAEGGRLLVTLGGAIRGHGKLDPALRVLARIACTELGDASAVPTDSDMLSERAKGLLVSIIETRLAEYGGSETNPSAANGSSDPRGAVAARLISELHTEERGLLQKALVHVEKDEFLEEQGATECKKGCCG